MSDHATKHLRYNLIVNILDGSFFGSALGFASFITVIPLFVSRLTDSAILIGLIPAIHTVGWQLPQLLTASRVSRLSRIKPMVLWMTIHERLPFLGLGILAWFSPSLNIRLALVITYSLLVWQGFGGGLTATAWQSMVAKIMPMRLLGTFYGFQSAAGNLFASVGAVLAGVILEANDYPIDFTICFSLAGGTMLLSMLFLGLTREETINVEQKPATERDFWGHLKNILERDRNFRWFILARLATQFSLMGFAFYTVYAVKEFGISEISIGILTGLLLAVQVSANPILGWFGDRYGHRQTFQFGVVAATASTFLAWLAGGTAWFYPIFLLAGIANAAGWTIPMAMTVEFGQESDRPAYIGLANTLIAPGTFVAPIIGGVLADFAGYPAAFMFSSVSGIFALLILTMVVRDPRREIAVRNLGSS
jgi:MFS family permease